MTAAPLLHWIGTFLLVSWACFALRLAWFVSLAPGPERWQVLNSHVLGVFVWSAVFLTLWLWLWLGKLGLRAIRVGPRREPGESARPRAAQPRLAGRAHRCGQGAACGRRRW